MFCPNCGKDIPDSAKFCKYCGTQLNKNNESEKKEDNKASPVLIGAVVVAAIVLIALIIFAVGTIGGDNNSNQEVINDNGVLVVSLSAFPVSEAPNLAQALSEQGYPSSISFKSVELDTSQCLYILTKSIVEIAQGNVNGTIDVGNPNYAPYPSGADISQTISSAQYIDICNRFSTWIESNGQVPNYVGINTGGVPDISPLNMLYIASDILISYKSTGQLPETAYV